MRHKNAGRKLNRTTAHREAMLRNVVAGLFEHERITTTVPKAKEARRLAERCITYAKKGLAALEESQAELPKLKEQTAALRKQFEGEKDEAKQRELRKQIDRLGRQAAAAQAKSTHYRRLALKALHQKPVVKKLFDEIAPRYADRAGGYTRILKAGYRKGDNAPVALFELV